MGEKSRGEVVWWEERDEQRFFFLSSGRISMSVKVWIAESGHTSTDIGRVTEVVLNCRTSERDEGTCGGRVERQSIGPHRPQVDGLTRPFRI